MIIDAHVHFWNFDPVRDSWITERMEVIRRDFLPADLAPLLTANGVKGCVAVQADQSEQETNFLLALANQDDFIKGVVGWIDFNSPDINQKLEALSHHQKLKGFRHIAEGEATGFLVQDSFVNGIKSLKKHNYTYDVLIKHHQLQEAITLIDRVPNQPFVLDHCAKPDLTQSNLAEWQGHIKILAQNPNVYCKLSGLLTLCNWDNWKESDIFNCLDVVFDNFGTERVLFASDWPVMLLAGDYAKWLQLIKKYTERFTIPEKEMIFSKNTERYYKL